MFIDTNHVSSSYSFIPRIRWSLLGPWRAPERTVRMWTPLGWKRLSISRYVCIDPLYSLYMVSVKIFSNATMLENILKQTATNKCLNPSKTQHFYFRGMRGERGLWTSRTLHVTRVHALPSQPLLLWTRLFWQTLWKT